MAKIRIAILGIGNCVSSLIQGIHYYRDKSRQEAIGLMHFEMNGQNARNQRTLLD